MIDEPPDDSRARLRPPRSLVATMVHDLKNPLAALAGNLELLREELGATPPSGDAARFLDDALLLCERVVDQVQGIADLDAALHDELVVRRAVADVGVAVATAIARSRMDAAARQLTVDVSGAATAPVDLRLFTRVMQNLVDNAVRHASRRGRVVARIEPGADVVTVWVGNDGPPLTVDQRLAVFDRDYRSAERGASARAGKSFGLYFCRRVIEAHGGTLSVEERPGLTAVFVARIPAV